MVVRGPRTASGPLPRLRRDAVAPSSSQALIGRPDDLPAARSFSLS